MNDVFTYDGLHRLTGLKPGKGEAAFEESIAYDTTGRLQTRTGSLYQYTDPAHEHAATQVGTSTAYHYDANGSLLTRNSSDFVGTLDDENYLQRVTTGSGNSDFDRQFALADARLSAILEGTTSSKVDAAAMSADQPRPFAVDPDLVASFTPHWWSMSLPVPSFVPLPPIPLGPQLSAGTIEGTIAAGKFAMTYYEQSHLAS